MGEQPPDAMHVRYWQWKGALEGEKLTRYAPDTGECDEVNEAAHAEVGTNV
jgi:hypothetical protein